MKLRALLYIIIAVVLSNSCKKEKAEPDQNLSTNFSNTPEITFLSLSSNDIRQFKDSLTAVIEYKDGDGDLGWDQPDSMSLYITDSRDPSIVEDYFVPMLAPQGSSIQIKGTLKVNIPFSILLNQNDSIETFTYGIRLKDRAGNWSNSVNTSNVTVRK